MDTYFTRHTQRLAVSDDVVEQLRRENTVGIHCPADGAADVGLPTYSPYFQRSVRVAISVLEGLVSNGGYVWAEYRTSSCATIGFVPPGSEIRLRKEAASGESRGAVVLCTVPLAQARRVARHALLSLRARRPRHGTLCRWMKAGDTVELLVRREPPKFGLALLTRGQLEAACAEYLREDLSGPRLKHLLMPVGRTLQDVDIYGVASDGRLIFAQVTHLRPQDVDWRMRALRRHQAAGAHLVLFCECDQDVERHGIRFVPTTAVEGWLAANPDISRNLQPTLEEVERKCEQA